MDNHLKLRIKPINGCQCVLSIAALVHVKGGLRTAAQPMGQIRKKLTFSSKTTTAFYLWKRNMLFHLLTFQNLIFQNGQESRCCDQGGLFTIHKYTVVEIEP
ncbi:MAG: hypothetical protein C4582_05255 [Desulfobacteraceae bacterium]|nr:MAG: hypothetical protein C4582_05255 [Desulfobacteraceae bacterium]